MSEATGSTIFAASSCAISKPRSGAMPSIVFSWLTISAVSAPPVFGSSSANKARASSSAAVTGGVAGPVLRLFVNASTRNWMVAPAPPPYSADSPVPPNRSRSGLYPCSTRFCTISDVASCAPSAPPVTAALVTR